jgi:DNA-directed RNA polymerase subunit F
MTKPEILEKQPLSLVELKSALAKVKKRDEELGFRAGKTEEYVNMVVKSTQKQSNELRKKIEELDIPRLKPEHIVKVLDTLPRSVAELKVVLQGYPLTVSNDNLSQIVSAVNDVVPVKK